MRYISKEEYNNELRKIKRINSQKALQRKLKEERKKGSHKIKIETNKVMAIYLFVLLNAIVIYAMTAMWKFGDLSYLGILISDIAAQVLIYGIYCMKAYKGKKAEEEMKFKREKQLNSSEEILDVGTEIQEPISSNNNFEMFGNENSVG